MPQASNKSFGKDVHDMAARMDKISGFQGGRSAGKSSEREAGKPTQSLSLECSSNQSRSGSSAGPDGPLILHRDFCLQQPAGDGEFWLDLSLSTTAF